MPLKVSQGIEAWIDDFRKSDAPQFKGKNEEERRDMAVAAYLSAKRGPEKEERVRQETLAAQGKDVFERQKGMFKGNNEAKVNEISKGKLTSYIKKAGQDKSRKWAQRDLGRRTSDDAYANQVKRNKGIDMAKSKMKNSKVAASEATNNLTKKEAMTAKQKADLAKQVAAFKAKGGKVKKLPPGKAAGYHGKDDLGTGMKGMLDKGDSRAIGTRKKARSLGASYTREWQEMYGDVILENAKLKKIKQLGMLGLVDRGDVQKLMTAMKAMDAGKEVPKNQRKIIFDAFGSLIDLVTGDTTVFQKAKKAVKEEVEKDPNEYDNEGEMMKDHLDIIMDAADEIYDIVDDDENLPEWCQNKITKGADYIDSVRDYLMAQDRDEPEDATNEAIRMVKDTNALTRYKMMVNKGQVDDDGIRMAIDNPKHPEVKRLMKDKKFKSALDLYKQALGIK
jgi:hypothetical protein